MRLPALPHDAEPNAVFDLPDKGEIAAVLCHFNPCLYHSPVHNLHYVLHWLGLQGIPTYAAEVRSGLSANVAPALPASHPKVLQIVARSTLFRKDNLWNIVASRLPSQFRFVLCLDADVILTDPDWKNTLLSALDRDLVVQPFTRAVWTDSERLAFKEKPSCAYGYRTSAPSPQVSHNFHSGFAIAAHRDLWVSTRGFYNCPIGGGSLFFVSGLMGLENELESKLSDVSPALLHHYRRWAAELHSWGRGKFGYTRGDAVHLWHGSRAKRRYRDRFDALRGFVPDADIEEIEPFGLQEWTDSARTMKPDLVAQVDEYFSTREEDESFSSAL